MHMINKTLKVHEDKKCFLCLYIINLLIMLKSLTVWITTNCGNFLNMWEYQATYPSLEKSVCRLRSSRTRLGTTGYFQIGKGVHQVEFECCHLAYIAYMWNTSCKMPDWMKHKLNQDCRKRYQKPQICR